MPRNDENENEDDEEDDKNKPSDFFKFFTDPSKIDLNKIFKTKDFQHLFKDIFKKISNNLPKEFQGLSLEDIKKEFMKNKSKFGFEPIIHGFNINIGSDGKPTIDSFGNIKTKPSGKPEINPTREPLVEVSEETDQITIIAEMPGVIKEEIEIKATSHSLTISTKSNKIGRNYYKEIDLPSAINSDYAKARYINGILSIKLKKIKEENKNIKID